MLYGRTKPAITGRRAGVIMLAVLVLCGGGTVALTLRIDRPEPPPAAAAPSDAPPATGESRPVVVSPAAPEVRPSRSSARRSSATPSATPTPTATPAPSRSSAPARSPAPTPPATSPAGSSRPAQTPLLGAACSPEGSTGETVLGTPLVCTTRPWDGDLRWRLL